jgi:hypothetical protein
MQQSKTEVVHSKIIQNFCFLEGDSNFSQNCTIHPSFPKLMAPNPALAGPTITLKVPYFSVFRAEFGLNFKMAASCSLVVLFLAFAQAQQPFGESNGVFRFDLHVT